MPARWRVRGGAVALGVVLAGCAGGEPTPPAREFPMPVLLSNALVAPVTIAIDGVPVARLSSDGSLPVTVSSTAQWLTWTSAKPTNDAGRPIADDIGEVRVRLSGIGPAFEVTNIIDGQQYISARFYNHTDAALGVGVHDGAASV